VRRTPKSEPRGEGKEYPYP